MGRIPEGEVTLPTDAEIEAAHRAHGGRVTTTDKRLEQAVNGPTQGEREAELDIARQDVVKAVEKDGAIGWTGKA